MGGPGSGRKKGSSGTKKSATKERNKTVGSGSGMLNKKETRRAKAMVKKPRQMP